MRPSWRVELDNGLKRGKDPARLPKFLAEDQEEYIVKDWRGQARRDQWPPDGDWLVWLLLGGRGAGKTRAGAEWVRAMALGLPPYAGQATGPIAIVGETFSDVREVMIEGVSGLLTIHRRDERPVWQKTRRRLEWNNGFHAQAFTSEDPEGLRGPQFSAAWSDGVGHTAAAGAPRPVAGMTVDRAEALRILADDTAACERRVALALGPVAQTAFDGAVSFDFNTGAIDRATWVAAWRSGARVAARRSLLSWTKVHGRTIAGLVRRREAEARLIFDGDYGTGGSRAAVDVRAVQQQLAALGFAPGPADGVLGIHTRAAILAYQRTHPDLVADGVPGPATGASLARDVAARTLVRRTAGASTTASATAGVAAAAAGNAHPVLAAAAIGLAVLALAGLFLIARYSPELHRMFTRRKGN